MTEGTFVHNRFRADPRPWQAAVLCLLATWGVGHGFGIRPANVAAIVATALAVQWAGCRWAGLRFTPFSTLITCLSLVLLLRTGEPWVAAMAAAVAIGGKFLLRVRGKHLFNPSALGLVAAMLLTGQAWVSPGQWGHLPLFALAVAGAGTLIVTRAGRADIALAFLGSWCAVLFGRALWLGDPFVIPWHQLQNGALLLFAFYMISDPRTVPDSRSGRVLFAALVAALGAWLQFGRWWQDGLIWALVAASPLIPLIDKILPGPRHTWGGPATLHTGRTPMLPKIKRPAAVAGGLAALMLLAWGAVEALAFCGFYVAKADTKLFNQASKVVLVRDGDRTVLTMANDYQGKLKDFAIVIPVPTFLEREQIHVAENALIDHLDAYTAPRLVEYFDEDPCQIRMPEALRSVPMMALEESGSARAKSLGVTIEASYTVGEYDILILSAEQSDGLETWLNEEGYKLPKGARRVLGSYIAQNMRFFVARVNLEEQAKAGYTYLRPLQVAYESKKFMLPIRLGTVNARGSQELFVFAINRQGRVEVANYPTVRLPTGMDIPVFVKDDFAHFYRDMFGQQVKKEDMRAVFLEYAWDMNWCDPCAADPLTPDELRELGVFWLAGGGSGKPGQRRFAPGGAQNAFVTRMHLRYDADHFPEDLVFHQTSDRQNFQGRYVLRHPWKPAQGSEICTAGEQYLANLGTRLEQESQALAHLTGWDINDIRRQQDMPEKREPEKKDHWWRHLWGG